MTAAVSFHANMRLGTTADRSYVVVRCQLSTVPGEHVTVTHGTVSDPVRLSLSGEVVEYRHRDAYAAGQIVDTLDEITTPAPGWTLDEIREVREIWQAWHLNDMRAACAHMDPNTLVREPDSYGGSRIACGAANTCPVSGYTYGSAWLTAPLPDDIQARIRHLFRDRSQALYRARGYDGNGNAVQS
jgi:hypothetical protein